MDPVDAEPTRENSLEQLAASIPQSRPRCSATTNAGNPCPVNAQINGLCFAHWNCSRSPEERSEQAKQGGQAPRFPRVPLRTAQHVIIFLESLAGEHIHAGNAYVVEVKIKIALAALRAQERLEAVESRKHKGLAQSISEAA